MNITLYHIEGISRSDTPFFGHNGSQATINDQEEFFSKYEVTTIESCFYPPHYNNVIKFDTDDVNFNSSINYLSFKYGEKTYYYFIDDIEYVSESVIRLYITMDVIQTYWFNIKISSGIIERKFINRSTTDSKINRNYLRENVSNGNYINKEYITYNDPYNDGFIFCKIQRTDFTQWEPSGDWPGNVLKEVINLDGSLNDKIVNYSGVGLMFSPVSHRRVLFKADTEGAQSVECKTDNFVQVAARDPYAHDLYFIPFNPFQHTILQVNSGNSGYIYGNAFFRNVDYKYQTSHDDIWLSHPLVIATYGSTLYSQGDVWIEEKKHEYRFDIELPGIYNNFIEYNSKYITQMLDDNYMRISFGTNAVKTTYPLYTLDNNIVYLKYIGDVLSGKVIYYINDNLNSSEDSKQTYVIDDGQLSMEMINDTWKNYEANNKNRWLTATAKTAANVFSMYALYGVGAKYDKLDIDRLSNNVTKAGKLTKKAGLKIGDLKRDIDEGRALTAARSVGATTSGLIGQLGEDLNMMYAPDTIRKASQFGDILSKVCTITSWLDKVDDYEQCAMYYHRNGYKVDEYVYDIDNIFEYVKNRRVFNILKMKSCEVHLHDIIEDETTVDLIKERLINGVRLWNEHPYYALYFKALKITYDNAPGHVTYYSFDYPLVKRFSSKGSHMVVMVGYHINKGNARVISCNNPTCDFNTGHIGFEFTVIDPYVSLDVDFYIHLESDGNTIDFKIGDYSLDNAEL